MAWTMARRIVIVAAVIVIMVFGLALLSHVTAVPPQTFTGYLVDNLFPFVNFFGIVLALIDLQYVRADLAARTKRFECIERELAAIQRAMDDRDGSG